MRAPLEGVRILDMTMGQHGPVATTMLADMGADVIKIEEPTSGDIGRYLRIVGMGDDALCAYFENNNRNKRGIALDLKKERAREIIYRLATKSDVFVSNFRPAALAKMGLDYAGLRKHNPKIIYAIATSWGRKGPDSDAPGLDQAAQARGGMMSISGAPNPPPASVGSGMADQVGAFILAYGIMLALFHKERTGEGQEVETSLLGSQVALGSIMLQNYLLFNQLTPQRPRKSTNPFWNIYRCQDNKWICLSMLWTDPYWHNFCQAMGLEELENDPRFDSNEKRTMVSTAPMFDILDEAFASKPREEWAKRLKEWELIWAPVNDYADIARDPQVLANDLIVDVDHPRAGPIKMVGIPVKLSKTPGQVKTGAPELGQHTEEVLLEIGGYTWDEIASLQEEGVF